MRNNGYQNELDFIDCFNGKKVCEIKGFMREILNISFGNMNDDEYIKAYKYLFHAKPDFVIEIKGTKHYYSLKTGKTKSIHSEGVKTLIEFLRENNVSDYSLITILFFQYGDNTIDGTGLKRYSFEEVISKMAYRIGKTNDELNDWSIVKKVVDRFVFEGNKQMETADVEFLIYGSLRDGYIVKREELIHYVRTRKYNNIKTIHFGPITIRPYVRNVERKSDNDYKRNIVQANWSLLEDDMSEICRLREK